MEETAYCSRTAILDSQSAVKSRYYAFKSVVYLSQPSTFLEFHLKIPR